MAFKTRPAYSDNDVFSKNIVVTKQLVHRSKHSGWNGEHLLTRQIPFVTCHVKTRPNKLGGNIENNKLVSKEDKYTIFVRTNIKKSYDFAEIID